MTSFSQNAFTLYKHRTDHRVGRNMPGTVARKL